MSYAVSNNYNNAGYNYDIFSRRAQAEEANSSQNFQQSTKHAQENASANTQARANSTEYPRASMNALMFVEEQAESQASAIVSETEEIEQIAEAENAEAISEDVYYMYEDPRVGDGVGKVHNYGSEYREGWDWWKMQEQYKALDTLFSYMDKYGIEEGEKKFKEEFGAEGWAATKYTTGLLDRNAVLDVTMKEQFKLAMIDFGLVYELDYFALADNKELLDQVQANFEERMSNLGYEKADRQYAPYLDVENGTVMAKDPETGEMIVVDTIKQWPGDNSNNNRFLS